MTDVLMISLRAEADTVGGEGLPGEGADILCFDDT